MICMIKEYWEKEEAGACNNREETKYSTEKERVKSSKVKGKTPVGNGRHSPNPHKSKSQRVSVVGKGKRFSPKASDQVGRKVSNHWKSG